MLVRTLIVGYLVLFWSMGIDNWVVANEVSPTLIISNVPTLTSSPMPQGPLVLIELDETGIDVDKDESLTLSVRFIGSTHHSYKNATYYMRAVIYEPGTTRYFGINRANDGSWYSGSDDRGLWYSFLTDELGTWTGVIELKVDPEQSNYKGPGMYELKVGRYTKTGSSAAQWSESVAIEIKQKIVPSITPTKKPTIKPTIVPSKRARPSPEDVEDSEILQTDEVVTVNDLPEIEKVIMTPFVATYPAVASVAGIIDLTNATDSTLVTNTDHFAENDLSRKRSWLSLVGILVLIGSAGSVGYRLINER